MSPLDPPINLDPVDANDKFVDVKDRQRLVSVIKFARGVDWSQVSGLSKEHFRTAKAKAELGFRGTSLYEKYSRIIQRNCPGLVMRSKKRKNAVDSVKPPTKRKTVTPVLSTKTANSDVSLFPRFWSISDKGAGHSIAQAVSSSSPLKVVSPGLKTKVSTTSRLTATDRPALFTYTSKAKTNNLAIKSNMSSHDVDDDLSPEPSHSHKQSTEASSATPDKSASSNSEPRSTHFTIRIDHNVRNEVFSSFEQSIYSLEREHNSLMAEQSNLRRKIEQAHRCDAQNRAKLQDLKKELAKAEEACSFFADTLDGLRSKLRAVEKKTEQVSSGIASKKQAMAEISKACKQEAASNP